MKTILKYVACVLTVFGLLCTATFADTVVNFGSIGFFGGPGDLDLDGDIVKAINFNGPDLTVAGVTFTSDVGDAELIGPQNVVGWQTRPEYGSTVDDDNLEQIMHDIRWANSANGENLEAHVAVDPGTYKIQLLISGNHQEARVWDIRVEDIDAVDNLYSLGTHLDVYDPSSSVVYTATVTPTDGTLDIVMGQLLDTVEGDDANPIWQALTVERVPEPATGLMMLLGACGLLALRRRSSRG